MTVRRPRAVYESGDEPDPRFSLANERTFLAWVRTALAVLAGALALESLGVPRQPLLRDVLVVTMVLSAGAVTGLAYRRWAQVERAMRSAGPLPGFALGAVVAGAVVVASIAVVVVTVLT